MSSCCSCSSVDGCVSRRAHPHMLPLCFHALRRCRTFPTGLRGHRSTILHPFFVLCVCVFVFCFVVVWFVVFRLCVLVFFCLCVSWAIEIHSYTNLHRCFAAMLNVDATASLAGCSLFTAMPSASTSISHSLRMNAMRLRAFSGLLW